MSPIRSAMSNSPSTIEHIEVILEPLLALGLITAPEEVRETYTRGYREQVIGDTHFSTNADPDYWNVQVQRASENLIRGAQTFLSTLAVQRHLSEPPSPSQVDRQIQELEDKLASLNEHERGSITGTKLIAHKTVCASNVRTSLPPPHRSTSMGHMPTQPLVSIDVVPFIVHEGELKLLTSVRQFDPFAGSAALPGVLLNANETLHEAVNRAMRTKAHATQEVTETLVAVFDDFDRDERGPTLSIAHLAILAEHPEAEGNALHPISDLPELPFDHNSIVAAAAAKLLDSLWVDLGLTRRLLGESFSTAEVVAHMKALAAAAGRPAPITNNTSRALGGNPALTKGEPKISGRGRPADTWRWSQ